MSLGATTLDQVERPSPLIGEMPVNKRLRGIPNLFFLDGTTSDYVDVLRYGKAFAEHYAKLKSLVSEPSLWPQGGERPGEAAKNWAWLVLQQLGDDDLIPAKVVASAEGGVAVCFVDGDKYADIECLNSGEILGVISNRRDRPVVWEIEQSTSDIAKATVRISEFLKGGKAEKNVSR